MLSKQQKIFYKKMFFFSAIYNWIISISFFFGYKAILPLLSMKPPIYSVFLLIMLFFVFVIGMGYYWVSSDINKNHDIIKMGALMKLGVVVLISWACLSNQIHPILIVPAIGDLIFILFFISFLKEYK
ncbi:MAG: hypothetical protein CMG54_02300 [Candidatus Marinimicrobia bacterium]|nr:hypothetical protein [Candidatus Neomarinimicrobiota bacterium]MBC21709.1 hypothetical protein [Candidatus Neomarinimicrobiota bacterium]|tara:strand:+ start:1017 stop:1400 length:384 start_codon:yes stop_codon:yes gene_type:complete